MDFNQLILTEDEDIRVKRAHAVSIEIESYMGHGPLEVMEFGCKTGLISLNLKNKISEGLLVDSSAENIKELEQKLRDRHLSHLQTYTGDILESDIDRQFDVIYSSMVMHHIKDFKAVIKKLVSYLKNNGKLIIVDLLPDSGEFHRHHLEFDGHHGFTINEMVAALKEAGLKEVTGRKFYSSYKPIENKNHPYSLFSVIGMK
ncbi:class I SAM-dependent methyltransferase [Turicibacter sp. TJ11]|uniref:class I SAM-dependent DNA methyltransferase n=1 Tax=Turicibacter sp. TJ11 TaxID=2806443 RepID=UPI001F1C8DDA|nr:class I SAM-dependent methyltransferase [Turicibacter sp. TJ11]